MNRPREKFDTEQKCRDYFDQKRWNGKPVCPHCEHGKVYRFSDGKRFKCAKCRKQFTVKVGTIMEGSNLSLRKWFMVISLITSNTKGISSLQVSRHLHITQKSAWFLLHSIRSYKGKMVMFGLFERGSEVRVEHAYIYGLIDPVSDEIKYIGKTVNPKVRLWQHFTDSKKPGRCNKKEAWVRSLLNQGLKPKIIIL